MKERINPRAVLAAGRGWAGGNHERKRMETGRGWREEEDGRRDGEMEGEKEEGGYSVLSGEGGTQAAGEEVTMEMLKRGSSQKEGRAGTQMSDCSSRGRGNSLFQTLGRGEWCWGRLSPGFVSSLTREEGGPHSCQ